MRAEISTFTFYISGFEDGRGDYRRVRDASEKEEREREEQSDISRAVISGRIKERSLVSGNLRTKKNQRAKGLGKWVNNELNDIFRECSNFTVQLKSIG